MARLDVSLGTFQSINTNDAGAPAAEYHLPQGAPATIGWWTLNRGDVVATATTGTNVITPTAGQANYAIPTNGSRIIFTYVGTSGLTEFVQSYYVINATATTFQISLTSGGSAVALSNSAVWYIMVQTPTGFAGAQHTIYVQPQRYGEVWTVSRITVQTIYTNNTGQIVQSGSGVLVPTVAAYYGVISPSCLIDQTQNGIMATDDLSTTYDITSGVPLILQFSNVSVTAYPANTRCWLWLGGTTNR